MDDELEFPQKRGRVSKQSETSPVFALTLEIGETRKGGKSDEAMHLIFRFYIKAHTVVAAPGYVIKEGKASMGNYNHFMTIQEMIDT